VTGEFDDHAVQPEAYDLLIEQVAPGDEGELTDDDENSGDDDDDDDGCGCAVGGEGGDAALAWLLLTLATAFLLLRKKATR